jgi:Flp pilus assembly protein TadG
MPPILNSHFLSRCAAVRFRRRTGDHGASLVEYAFIVVFFMTILFGIGGFGHALYAYHFVSNAAREATRWAAVRGSTCTDDGSCAAVASKSDIQNYVKTITPQAVDFRKVTITSSWPAQVDSPQLCTATPKYPGCTVQVQVQYTFNLIFPLVITSPLTLSSSSKMVIVH